MTLLNSITQSDHWEKFYRYKKSIVCSDSFLKELKNYMENQTYLAVSKEFQSGTSFPLPRKSVISKLSSDKKRIVYSYPKAENMMLKLLAYELTRKYDDLFCNNLYSFRPGRTAKNAIRKLTQFPGIDRMYSYKVDIHNYFNSVSIPLLLPTLRTTLAADPELYSFLSGLLLEPKVIQSGELIEEEKGIMAGTPLATFYANLYLKDLDEYFEKQGILYARYSDDIIVFAPSREEIEIHANYIKKHLESKKLSVNPKKENYYNPGDAWTFLGFQYQNGVIDIAPVTVRKLKKKMRRKMNSLRRWHMRNHLESEKAAKAFIRIFNSKLFEHPDNHELSWSYWFFSVINTSNSLKIIDNYSQECIRYLLSGTRTKARYQVRYEDLKKLGYRNLVHEYYHYDKQNL